MLVSDQSGPYPPPPPKGEKSSGSDDGEKSRPVSWRFQDMGSRWTSQAASASETCLLAGTALLVGTCTATPRQWHVMALARGDSVVREDVQVVCDHHAGSWDESERNEGFASASPDSDGLYWFRAVEPAEGRISLSFALDEGESESGVEPLRHEIDTEIAQQRAKREAPPTKRATKRPVPASTRTCGQTQLLLTKPDGSSAFARQGQKIQASSSSNGSDRGSGTRQARSEKRNIEGESGEDEGWISGDVAGRSGGTRVRAVAAAPFSTSPPGRITIMVMHTHCTALVSITELCKQRPLVPFRSPLGLGQPAPQPRPGRQARVTLKEAKPTRPSRVVTTTLALWPCSARKTEVSRSG